MKGRLLFVVSSLNYGGPQKSLVGLLQRLDPEEFDVSLMTVDGAIGDMSPYIPDHVTIVPTSPGISAMALSSRTPTASVVRLCRELGSAAWIPVLRHVIRGRIQHGGMQRVRQLLWAKFGRSLEPIRGEFDAAFGILGLSTYIVTDLVDASHRYHWIRSDSRVLGRDEEIEEVYFNQLSGCLSVSDACSEIFEQMYPSMKDKTLVYKNDIPSIGVAGQTDFLDLRLEGNKFVCVTTARLDKLKGIELAIDALALLRERGFQATWVVLGDGPMRAELEDAVRRRELEEYFLMPGSVANVASYLLSATVYVHPSRTEGRSNAVEEARACGVPVLATNYETVGNQIEHGVSGLVCAMSPTAIADGLQKLFNDVDLRDRLGAEAKRRYEQEIQDPNVLFKRLCDGDFSGARAELL